jgi:hypothetical protein
MRGVALVVVLMSCAAGSVATAQTRVPDLTAFLNRDALNKAAFAKAPVGFDDDRLDKVTVKSWPKAVSFESDSFEFEVAPHAGFGVSARGRGQAEGGATITVSPKTRGERAMAQLRDMGVKDGGSYGDAGRWYLFAAASGQAVGLNMMRSDRGGWDRAGWSTDTTGALVGDAQVGVGWRKGDMQSSFGVIHREVKGQHMVFGQQTRDDTVAAFTFSFRPQK